MGPAEFAIVLAAVIILFGGKRIPQLTESMGEMVRNFRKGVDEEFKEVDSEVADEPEEDDEPRRSSAKR